MVIHNATLKAKEQCNEQGEKLGQVPQQLGRETAESGVYLRPFLLHS